MNTWKLTWKRIGLLAVLLALLPATVVWAAPPVPSIGTANVDGNPGEWDLTNDFFAELHEAWNGEHPTYAKLYLRYDCDNNILYALVLAEAGSPIDSSADGDHFIRLTDTNVTYMDESDGDDDSAPDFHYINQSGDTADGWEGSALIPPGTYDDLRVHTNVTTDSGQATAGVIDKEIDLAISCDETTAVTITSLTARGTSAALPIALATGGVALLGGLAIVFRRRP